VNKFGSYPRDQKNIFYVPPLILHYLARERAVNVSEPIRWVSFRELASGSFFYPTTPYDINFNEEVRRIYATEDAAVLAETTIEALTR